MLIGAFRSSLRLLLIRGIQDCGPLGFQYDGLIYEQQEGAAMGSPVSAVIANLYMEDFEEQTLTSTPCMPKIWKRYVDDTFTILSRDKVDIFLQHLNSQQPTIHLTMETETNNTIPFLDTLVTRYSDGYLSTSVYRKSTHTDQYLAYDSHHPQSVKRGIVKCLYDRSKHLITKPSVISQEKKHLSSVLVSNGCPFSFVKNITKTKKQTATKEPAPEIKSTAVLPYVKGLSEALRRCLQQQGIRTVFRSDTTLRSHLVRPKDTVDPAKQGGVVYKIPCECGKVYIGETGRSMHERIKEHDRDIRHTLGFTMFPFLLKHIANPSSNVSIGYSSVYTLLLLHGVINYLDMEFYCIHELLSFLQCSFSLHRPAGDWCMNEIDPETLPHKSLGIGAKLATRSSFRPL